MEAPCRILGGVGVLGLGREHGRRFWDLLVWLILEQLWNVTKKFLFHASTFTAGSVVTTTTFMFCPTGSLFISKHETYHSRVKYLCSHLVRPNAYMFTMFVCVGCPCAGRLFWYFSKNPTNFRSGEAVFFWTFFCKMYLRRLPVPVWIENENGNCMMFQTLTTVFALTILPV